MEWYLKKENDEQYGPESLSLLREWAEQGRIGPGDMVSRDAKAWVPAPTLPELEMMWLVELPDGSTYGPVHILGLREPLNSGELLFHSPIKNHNTGKQSLLGKALLEAMDQRIELLNQRVGLEAGVTQAEADRDEIPVTKDDSEPEADPREAAYENEIARLQKIIEVEQSARHTLEDLVETLQATPPAPPEPPAPSATESEQVLEIRQKMDHLQHEAERWKYLYEELNTLSQEREHTLTERIEQYRKDEIAIRSSLDSATVRLEQMGKGLQWLDARPSISLEENDVPEEIAGPQVLALLNAYTEMVRQHDLLLSQLAHRDQQIEALTSDRSRVEQSADERMQELEERVRREKEEADDARQRLAELERAQRELLQAYREINDRFIHFRQGNPRPEPRDPAQTPPRNRPKTH